MRKVIKDIIKILNCTEEFANKVEFEMQVNAVDFSGCTKAEFKREVYIGASFVI